MHIDSIVLICVTTGGLLFIATFSIILMWYLLYCREIPIEDHGHSLA